MVDFFFSACTKYGSSRCFSPGSFAVLSGAAPPPFRIFVGGLPRRRRRRNAFGLIQEYCTKLESGVSISCFSRDCKDQCVSCLWIPPNCVHIYVAIDRNSDLVSDTLYVWGISLYCSVAFSFGIGCFKNKWR